MSGERDGLLLTSATQTSTTAMSAKKPVMAQMRIAPPRVVSSSRPSVKTHASAETKIASTICTTRARPSADRTVSSACSLVSVVIDDLRARESTDSTALARGTPSCTGAGAHRRSEGRRRRARRSLTRGARRADRGSLWLTPRASAHPIREVVGPFRVVRPLLVVAT
jgi:hypothetical protein